MSFVPPDARQQTAIEVTSYLTLGCMILFGAPFFLVGMGVLIGGLLKFRSGGAAGEAAVLAAFGLVFALVGFAVMSSALASIRHVRETAALRKAHPGQPWMWRKEWVTGRIADHRGKRAGRIVAFAIFWNLVSVPFVFMVPRAAWRTNPVLWVALIFPVVGAALLVLAARALLEQRKFRSSILALTTFPARVGDLLRGSIETTIASETSMTEGSFALTLRCVNRWVTGSGKNQSTRERTLWESGSSVPFVSCAPSPYGGMTVPVALAIPGDAAPTNNVNPRDQIVWRLLAKAELPGIDYDTQWDVPVY